MKRITRWKTTLVLWLGIFSCAAMAQAPQQLPIDPQVRVGVLDNGLTYYIRHNELPKDRAEFHIAQKVGSMQEEESQRELAHFLEHMAFNGTTHFPDKTMLEYLESIGAKFGANVNAYTSFDETVYTLMNIPVTRPGIVDSCLLILYDWSCGIALVDEEIDNERGVIHEEWRTGQSAQMRIFDQILPVIFEGSRYGHRLPIGLMEVVDHFPYQDIRDYYHKWYRPDLQGLIIVGDIDVDYVEAKIKAMFSDIPLDDDRAERIYHEVPDNREPIVALATDKEMKNVRTTILYKKDIFPREYRNTPDYYVDGYLQSMISSMLNTRYSELVQSPDPPFLSAGTFSGAIMGITKTKDAFNVVAISDEDHIERGLRTVVQEVQRAVQHGFTPSEYERARANFLNGMESAYNEREKQRNSSYTDEYTRAFLDGEPIPGIELEYNLFNQLAPMLPVEAVNEYMKTLVTDDNIIITVQGPEKEGLVYPSREEILTIFREATETRMEPYREEVSDEPLISEFPQPGTIVKTEKDTIFDATVWTLSNGATVVVKPTTFKNDQIVMTGFSPGGTSVIDDRYIRELNFINSAPALGGLGNFSAVNLGKVLAGRNATASAGLGELTQNVSARCAPRDLETMMQLVYLQFTGVRQDH
ncbi:MAG: insulinase family protein [Rikenellaceae bacterium]|nr:insulinase family protein [Rikenellaceae bacterium]